MSLDLTVYRVKLQVVADVFGSRDRSIIEQLRQHEGAEVLDEIDEPMNRRELEEGTPTAWQALDEIVSFKSSEINWTVTHMVALELVVKYQGTELGMTSADVWQSRAGYVLKDRGLEDIASFKRLYNGPPPFHLGDEDAGVGYISEAEVTQALKVLRPLDVLGIEMKVAQHLLMFYRWIEEAETHKQGLIGFVS